MKLSVYLGIACVLCAALTADAQAVAINDDASLPHPSAILDIKVSAAAKKGVLLPRMTSAQRAAIAAPGKGLLVYDSTNNSFWFHNGTAWTEISKGINPWTVSGSNVYNLAGNIGIGVSTPKAKLNVVKNQNVLFGESMSGLGRKLFWNGVKGAFRAGQVMGEYPDDTPPYSWDDSNIGEVSFATGSDVTARGFASAAFGISSDANGRASLASGVWATANGDLSAAIGFAVTTTGEGAFANGYNTYAQGDHSAAFGESSQSIGTGSFAAGNETSSQGNFSATFGNTVVNNTDYSLMIGEFNAPLGTTTGPNSALFLIGNGTNSVNRNSFVALRNGIVSINKNPGTVAVNDGMLQVKQDATRHAFTMEAGVSNNKWSYAFVSNNLGLFYNNIQRGSYNAATGAYTAISDMRLKKDIKSLEPVLENIMQLKTYTYHLLDNDANDPVSFGLMAQELQQVFPDLVTKLDPNSSSSLLGINYSNLGVIALKAIQEQQEMLNKEKIAFEQKLAEQQRVIDLQQKQIDAANRKYDELKKMITSAQKGNATN